MKLLDAQQVLELHEYVLVRDGGLPGIRAGKSVDAVLARVANNLLFEFDPNASNAAALITYAFAIGHIFNDANKRTAYVCGLITLEINGVKTTAIDQSSPETIIIAAAAGALDKVEFVAAFNDLL